MDYWRTGRLRRPDPLQQMWLGVKPRRPEKWMEYQGHIFCGRCGAPMSDEAVQMVMERLEVVCSEAKAD